MKPGIAIIPAASIATSQPETSPPDPTDTIRPSAITMVSPDATGDAMSPLRILPMLNIAVFIASDCFARVYACLPADTPPWAGGTRNRQTGLRSLRRLARTATASERR